MPTRFSSKSSLAALLLYLILLAAWGVGLYQAGEPVWWLGFAPFYGLGLVFLVKGEVYRIEGFDLLVKHPFERKRIPLSEIHTVQKLHNPWWKQALLGFPAVSLQVAYRQYEEVLLHPAQPENLEQSLRENMPRTSAQQAST